jgi:hypothetical protein
LCETSYSDHKAVNADSIVEQTIQGLINAGLLKEEDRKDIVSTWHYHADYSYPTPTVERDALLSKVIPYLEDHEIYSRGRFGMWKDEVANTDHSLMQGVELINRLLFDEPEQTIGIKYESTLDGRNAATHDEKKSVIKHERSHLAGSGDPKKAKERSELAAALSTLTKDSPESPAASPPGQAPSRSTTKTAAASGAMSAALASIPARSRQPGDKPEAHVSEEELGITTQESRDE